MLVAAVASHRRHAEIAELDINPLLADAQGVIALDARIRVRRPTGPAPARLAIRPYPQQLESEARDRRRQRVRAAADPAGGRAGAASVRRGGGSADLWHPVFALLRERGHETAARLTQIDYDREMTMLAWEGARVAGLARSAADPDFETAEAAVIIRADLRDKGLATQLLELLLQAVADQGVHKAVLLYPARTRSPDRNRRRAPDL